MPACLHVAHNHITGTVVLCWCLVLSVAGGGGGVLSREKKAASGFCEWTGGPSIPLCDIPSGCCFFAGPWTVTRSSPRVLHQVAVLCRPLQPVLLLVSFPRSRSPVVGVLGLCWLRRMPFVHLRCPIVGVPGVVLVVAGDLQYGAWGRLNVMG